MPKNTGSAKEIIVNVLDDFYRKPTFTTREREIVWQLSMAVDELNFLDVFDAFEVHPCKVVSKSVDGKEIMEQCEENDPEITCWSLFGHYPNRGLECIGDFTDKKNAQTALALLQKYL